MTNSHWAQRSQHWNRSVPPLRYDAVALATLKELVGDRTDRIVDRKSTRLNSSHSQQSRMPSSA